MEIELADGVGNAWECVGCGAELGESEWLYKCARGEKGGGTVVVCMG